MGQSFLNMEFMKTLAWSVIAPRQTEYSEDIFRDLTRTYPHLITTHPKITNKNGEKLKSTIMASVYQDGPCYIYLHALGSNRTEGLLTLKHLPKQASLVLFDFSGAGKSEGEYVSYGNKEKEDLESVLQFLRKHYDFKNFLLWGRSMGAATALMHNRAYNPLDVSTLILDSPFYSFQQISKDIVRQRVPSLPQFLIDSLVSLLRFACRKIEYNPFDVNFQNLEVTTPALFVYSQTDTVVNCEHTFKISRIYKGIHDTICIQQDHNEIRPATFYKEALQKSNQLNFKEERLKLSRIFRKSRGIHLTIDNSCILKDSTFKFNTQRVNITRSRIKTIHRGSQV